MSIFKGLFSSVCKEIISSAFNHNLARRKDYPSRTTNGGKPDLRHPFTPAQAEAHKKRWGDGKGKSS